MNEQTENTVVTDDMEQAQQPEAKTYTQEEVNALLQKESDKRVTEAMKKAERKKQEAIKEATKLAKMSEEERYQHELEQREKAIQEKENQLALAENKAEASNILAQKGISPALVDLVVAADADTMFSNITMLEDEFKKSVAAEVNKRLQSTTPKRNLPTGETITKDAFKNMSLSQRAELYNTQPELYKRLSH